MLPNVSLLGKANHKVPVWFNGTLSLIAAATRHVGGRRSHTIISYMHCEDFLGSRGGGAVLVSCMAVVVLRMNHIPSNPQGGTGGGGGGGG